MRSPHFYKSKVVGLVVQLDRMLSKNEAVFVCNGDEVFVSGVPPMLFQDKEQTVLAGRATGNKGLIDPSGDESLVPALDYVTAVKCGNVYQRLTSRRCRRATLPAVGTKKRPASNKMLADVVFATALDEPTTKTVPADL